MHAGILSNMEVKRKTTIEIETHRSVSFTAPVSAAVVLCPFCATQEQMLTPEQAAATFNISRRAIYRFVEQGTAHFVEIANGEVLLCPASIIAVKHR